MVVVGADVHKRTHTFVAVDEVGRQLGSLTVSADRKGHAKALRWVRQMFPGDRIWGIGDCRHLSARLERDLLAGGESVVRVPPKLMAQTRARRRGLAGNLIRSMRWRWLVQCCGSRICRLQHTMRRPGS